MSLRAVLFDAAGTLIHVRNPVGATYARIARAHGVIAAPDALERAFRTAIRAMPDMVFLDASDAECAARERAWWSELVNRVVTAAAPEARFDDFVAYFDAVFAHYAQPDAWMVADGATTTLAALRAAGLTLGVVSNFDHRLPGLLDGLGVSSFFDVVVRPADARAAKPNARIFHAALTQLGVRPTDALYVGDDDEEDVHGATAAGLHAVNITTLPRFDALLDYVTRL
jgi:putative hydrolase of the HAD superfamily